MRCEVHDVARKISTPVHEISSSAANMRGVFNW